MEPEAGEHRGVAVVLRARDCLRQHHPFEHADSRREMADPAAGRVLGSRA